MNASVTNCGRLNSKTMRASGRANGFELLFVGHDATRTGAPIALLHLLRWLSKEGRWRFSILLGEGGELAKDFADVAQTWTMDQSDRSTGTASRWARHRQGRQLHRLTSNVRLVYANSAASAKAIQYLAPSAPILTHVHELEFYLRAQPTPALSYLFDRTRRWVACSIAVRNNLIDRRGVDAERVVMVHESIPVTQIQPKRKRREVLRDLAIPEDASLVMGCGTMDWRKGCDLFLQLARMLTRSNDDVYCAWIGGFAAEIPRFEYDVRLAGLAERVRFTGIVANSADYLAAADVFVLTSREDPYPLVCLEAAALGKPIICFAGAGGMPEFVEEDCGFVVPYLDVESMAGRVLRLLESEECRSRMGKAAQQKVCARHDIEVAGPRIAEIIERTIAGR